MADLAIIPQQRPIMAMADRLSIDVGELEAVIKATIIPTKGNNGQALVVTNEQFVAFIAVANAYKLDPMKREIFAFPAKGGGIQPVVSIDGWLSILNSQPEFDGMELVENFGEGGAFESVTCTIHRKDHAHPTVITESLSECIKTTEPWKDKPRRMLRHKATIQCARYAFGLGGIMEEDEAQSAFGGEIDVSPVSREAPAELDMYSEILFTQNLPKWQSMIEAGKKSPAEIIDTVESKGLLTAAQKQKIEDCVPIESTADRISEEAPLENS